MVFNCGLCEVETCYLSRYCDKCQAIKRIINVYGHNEVLEILDNVCLRNPQQRQYKINDELKKEIINKKKLNPIKEEDTDESYEKPHTRNKKK